MPIAPGGAVIIMPITAAGSITSPQPSPAANGTEPIPACTVAFGRQAITQNSRFFCVQPRTGRLSPTRNTSAKDSSIKFPPDTQKSRQLPHKNTEAVGFLKRFGSLRPREVIIPLYLILQPLPQKIKRLFYFDAAENRDRVDIHRRCAVNIAAESVTHGRAAEDTR